MSSPDEANSRIHVLLRSADAETSPSVKALKTAVVCTALFRSAGYELMVVGGSAIEILTQGEYASGHIEMAFADQPRPPLRKIAELMGTIGAEGGPRNYRVAGTFVNLRSAVEGHAQTEGPTVVVDEVTVKIEATEDLIAERVLASVCPKTNPVARKCAKRLIAFALDERWDVDWQEVKRVARLPEYNVLRDLVVIKREVEEEIAATGQEAQT